MSIKFRSLPITILLYYTVLTVCTTVLIILYLFVSFYYIKFFSNCTYKDGSRKSGYKLRSWRCPARSNRQETQRALTGIRSHSRVSNSCRLCGWNFPYNMGVFQAVILDRSLHFTANFEQIPGIVWKCLLLELYMYVWTVM